MDIPFKVLGKTWKLRILSKKRYHKKHGKDSLAISVLYKRRIDIPAKKISLETMVHELVHAYLHEMCYKSTHDITTDDLEEIFAELMAKRGTELLKLAANLMTMLDKIRTENIFKKGLDKPKKV